MPTKAIEALTEEASLESLDVAPVLPLPDVSVQAPLACLAEWRTAEVAAEALEAFAVV